MYDEFLLLSFSNMFKEISWLFPKCKHCAPSASHELEKHTLQLIKIYIQKTGWYKNMCTVLMFSVECTRHALMPDSDKTGKQEDWM